MIEVVHILCNLNGGGAERLVLDLCRLRATDLRARVLTLHPGGELAGAFVSHGVPVYCADRPYRHPGFRALYRLAGQVQGVDLVHTHLWAGDTWGRIAARMVNHPAVISTIHNTQPDASWRGWLDRRLAPLSHRLVAVSEEAEASLKAGGYPSNSIVRINNGVDLERFGVVPLQPGRRVLAVGRLTRQKGFDLLIQALSGLPDVEADIVGEGEDRPRLQALAARCGGRVRLPGWQVRLKPWLEAAQVVVIPSRWEGFGLFAVEAMASGRPVVATHVDALPTVLGGAAVLVPPESPDALRHAITALLDDPPRQAALALLGVARAPLFDIRHTVTAYETLYRRLAATSPRR